MSDTLEPLVLDLVEWVADEPRRYDEVMAAWRTSCPRLPVWEEAVEKGYLVRQRRDGEAAMVHVTGKGRGYLASHGRATDPAGLRGRGLVHKMAAPVC